MTFFYFTTAGAVYFWVLATICLFAIWRGGKDYRLFALCVLGVFLADRTLLASFDIRQEVVAPLTRDEQWMLVLGGLAELIAILGVFRFRISPANLRASSLTAQLIAGLFAFKIFIYLGLLSAMMTFATMAFWTELAGYVQLGIIGGGTLNGFRGKLARNSGGTRPVLGGSRHSLLNWLSTKARP